MTQDPIVEEIHRIREAMLARFDNDLGKLVRHLQAKTQEAARGGEKVVSLPPRRPHQSGDAAKKAG